MSHYVLLGKSITFEECADRFCSIQFFAWENAKKCKNDFIEWYDQKSDIHDALSSYHAKAMHLIKENVISKNYDLLPQYKIYDVSHDAFFDRCLILDSVNAAFTKIAQKHDEINDEYYDEVEYRAERKANRSKWEGGGFGLGGAIKGAATAGALNAVSGLGHSVTNSIGNAASKANANAQMKNLYNSSKDTLASAVVDAALAASNEFITIVNEHINGCIHSTFNSDQAAAFLESAQKVPDEEASLLVSSFEKCPWNDDLYRYIFNKYEDERINLVKIAKDYHVDLSEEKENLLLSFCENKEAFEDESLAREIRGKMLKTMADLDVENSPALDTLEKTWLLKLCENYKQADEATCDEMKAKVNAYEALDSNKKVVTDMLQKRIEEIWAAEDNEIFDNYLLQTNILDAESVAAGIEYINSKGRTASKEVYLEAFNNMNLKNIKKAKRYNDKIGKGFMTAAFNYFGYFLILICVIDWLVADEPSFWLSTLPLIVGIAYEVYVNSLKEMWKKLTINGTVVHKIFKADKSTFNQMVSEATNK